MITIDLAYPIDVAGAKLKALRMRRPTVNDMLVSDATKGGDAAKELAMFSALTEQAPEDLRKLDLADYKKVQEAFKGFLG